MQDTKLEMLAARAPTGGLFFDFDGTLSEIVNLPHDARPLQGVREALETLSERFALVAVVSGRATEQLLDWLGSEIELWGLHGAERTKDGRIELSELARPFKGPMQTVLDEARSRVTELDIPGVVVEDKGVIVVLHYRATEDRGSARRALEGIADDLATVHGLLLADGKLAIELRPPGEFSKRLVIERRSREAGLDAVAFLGDDVVDLPGFDALDTLEREGRLTLRVAVDSDEAPRELLDRADVIVQGPTGVLALIQRLVELTGG